MPTPTLMMTSFYLAACISSSRGWVWIVLCLEFSEGKLNDG